MEHICHFPCCLCGITFNRMSQGIHTGRCRQSLRHGSHHFRVYNCDDRHIMRIYTDKLTLALYISNNIVDRNLCCCTCCGRNCYDRDAGLLCRCYALKAAYIFKLRIGNDDTDRLGSIHGGASADCNNIVCSGRLKGCHTVLYIINSRIGLDIGIDLISQSFFFQKLCYLCCHTKFDQVRIRTYKCLLKSMCLCLVCDLCDCPCSMIRGLIQHNSVCHK